MSISFAYDAAISPRFAVKPSSISPALAPAFVTASTRSGWLSPAATGSRSTEGAGLKTFFRKSVGLGAFLPASSMASRVLVTKFCGAEASLCRAPWPTPTAPPVIAPPAKASAMSHGSSWRVGSRLLSARWPTYCCTASVAPSVMKSFLMMLPKVFLPARDVSPAGTIPSIAALTKPFVVAARWRSATGAAARVGSEYCPSADSPFSCR